MPRALNFGSSDETENYKKWENTLALINTTYIFIRKKIIYDNVFREFLKQENSSFFFYLAAVFAVYVHGISSNVYV